MKAEINLKLREEKKHSVIYEPEDPAAKDPIVSSIYIMKLGMVAAGSSARWPERIKLTVEAV